MQVEHLVVIGASSGGIDAMRVIASGLPAGFDAPICAVVHTGPDSPGMLPKVLNRAGPVEADLAKPGEPLAAGRIYLAPPDRHLIVEPGQVVVTRGPKENLTRPAVDPLFRSAAQVYGPRVIGVVLTGGLDDGTAGLRTIKQLGGVTIVQDPADALFRSMPESALRHVAVDYCVPLADIAPLLIRLTRESVQERQARASETVSMEVNIAKGQNALDAGIEGFGRPSAFACPECHGVLREIAEGDEVRYRCHTGHAYSKATFLAYNEASVEDALWNAIRALEERARMLRSPESGTEGGPSTHDDANRALRDATILRELVTRRRGE